MYSHENKMTNDDQRNDYRLFIKDKLLPEEGDK